MGLSFSHPAYRHSNLTTKGASISRHWTKTAG